MPTLRLRNLILIGICLVTFLSYRPVLSAGFVNWDDDVHLTSNPAILSFDLSAIWSETVNRVYIPLTSTTFALEHHFFGLNPFVYHLNNLLLHLAATLLVYVLCRRLGFSFFLSAMASLIFGVHPAHVQSVAWVTERKDVLFGVFYLASLIAYCRYIKGEKRRDFVLSLFYAFLSILAKPMALSLFFTAALLDWWFKRPLSLSVVKEKFYFALVLAPAAWMTFIYHTAWFQVVPDKLFDSSFLLWTWCFHFYLANFFWPVKITLFHILSFPIEWKNPSYLATVFSTLGVLCLVFAWRRNRVVLFSSLFYFLSIFFIFKLSPSFEMGGSRYLYIPGIGLCILVAYLLERMSGRLSSVTGRRLVGVLCAVLILALSWKTYLQSQVWRNSKILWSYEIAHNARLRPGFLLHKLADAYRLDPDFRRAAVAYRLGRASKDDLKYIRQTLALAARSKTLWTEGWTPYYSNGQILKDLGHWDEALADLQTALARDPDNGLILIEIGEVYQGVGRADEAVKYYERIGARDPVRRGFLVHRVRKNLEGGLANSDHAEIYGEALMGLEKWE